MVFRKKKNWDEEYDEYYTQHDPEYGRRVKPKLWIHFSFLATLGVVFLVIVGASSGRQMVEQTIKSLISPVGLVWFLLAAIVYFALVYRAGWTAIAAFFCWLILTIGGNVFVAQYLVSSLESEYFDLKPLAGEPFDAVVVLGGGTTMAPSGTSQLSSAGDRVMLAARMHQTGLAKIIVTTGKQQYRRDETNWHPHKEAAEILKDIGVPENDLRMLGGINTATEFEEIAKWLETAPEAKDWRIGIITSAWHLPRAMALAESNNIQAEPVPAHFITEPYMPNPSIIVPSSANIGVTSRMMFEHLGRLIGR